MKEPAMDLSDPVTVAAEWCLSVGLPGHVHTVADLVLRVRDAADAAARAEEREKVVLELGVRSDIRPSVYDAIVRQLLGADHPFVAAPVQGQEPAFIMDHAELREMSDAARAKAWERQRHATREEPTKVETYEIPLGPGGGIAHGTRVIPSEPTKAEETPEDWHARIAVGEPPASVLASPEPEKDCAITDCFSEPKCDGLCETHRLDVIPLVSTAFERGIAEGVARGWRDAKAAAIDAAEAEPELPGEPPEDFPFTAESMRVAVRVTKFNIAEAIRSLPGACR